MIQNRIKNVDEFPYTGAYGYGDQGGRLLGVNFMHNLDVAYRSQDSSNEQIACEMGHTLAHEVTHQWSAKVGNNEADPNALMPMRIWNGLGLIHWSYGLNIGYDPVGGGRWQDNKDGTFTLLGPEEWCAKPKEGSYNANLSFPKMSDITLYLAGAMKKEEVKPMTWLEFKITKENMFDTGVGYTFRPQHTKTITIEDIVKKYGEVGCVKEEVLPRTMYGNEH